MLDCLMNSHYTQYCLHITIKVIYYTYMYNVYSDYIIVHIEQWRIHGGVWGSEPPHEPEMVN